LFSYILFEKYISVLETASPGNQHRANCIGTLSLPITASNDELACVSLGNDVTQVNQSISLFASKYTYMNNICQWQVARKTQSSTSWRPIIDETKLNLILEKHTIQHTKKTYEQKESKGQSQQKKN